MKNERKERRGMGVERKAMSVGDKRAWGRKR